jgi:hypothetical protein
VYSVAIAESQGLYVKIVGGKPQEITEEEASDFAYQFMSHFGS